MNALTGVLVEAHNKGIDIEVLTKTVSGGLMGLEIYAPASAEQKPKEVDSLKSALSEAQRLIAIKA
ncbi:hypothetical protein HQQ94_04410 [Shewanella sp. VB17]|uniref:hypothetical protein n=1 Tax=Shewanella sp. VB17 TaxID=2739432 RepID=UPI001565CDD4|nr:hypothetical protein [Shewanella sp. VB17]NRD72500.1 hypothetical protein [Shewanella sp. VB17]